MTTLDNLPQVPTINYLDTRIAVKCLARGSRHTAPAVKEVKLSQLSYPNADYVHSMYYTCDNWQRRSEDRVLMCTYPSPLNRWLAQISLSPFCVTAVFGSFGLHTTRTVDSMLNSTYYDLPRWLRSAYLPPLVNGISDLSVATCADAYLRNAISHLICTNSFEVHHFADNTTWVSKTDITRRVKSSHDIVLGHVELNAAWEERTVATVAGEEIVDAPYLEGYALCTFGAQRRTHTGSIDPSASGRTLSASITFRIQMPLRFH